MQIKPIIREFIYQEHGDGKTVFSNWKVVRESNRIAIDMFGGLLNVATTATFSPDWSLHRWKIEGEGYPPRHLEKNSEGKVIENHKEVFSPSLPWVQDPTFALEPFITSSQTHFSFHVIDPRNLMQIDLIAEKDGKETIQLGKQLKEALRIRLYLSGWKKWLWSGVAHYDPREGYLLRMEGKGVVPGSTFVKELFSQKNL